MKKKNTTEQDIEKAKTKADPTAAAQPANDEDIDNYMAAFDAKMEESLKKLENLIRNKKRSGASESEIKKAIQKISKKHIDFFKIFRKNQINQKPVVFLPKG